MISNPKELSEPTIVLTRAHLPDNEFKELFPALNQESIDLRAVGLHSGDEGRAIGFLAFERVSDICASVHTTFLKGYVIPSVLKLLKRDMLGNVQKYMEEEDIQTCIAVCDYNNMASMRLQKLMGYNPQPYWMGVQHRR